MVKIRQATPEDKKDFARLLILSAQYFPNLFGEKIEQVLQKIFPLSAHLFSYEHVIIASVNGETAGMLLAYSWLDKKKENLKTGLLLFKHLGANMLKRLGTFLKFNATVGQLPKKEFYISNIAVYPQFRGQGLGKKLMSKAEKIAYIAGAEKLCLDVEQDNQIAIGLYHKLGYQTTNEFNINSSQIKKIFIRMKKTVTFT